MESDVIALLISAISLVLAGVSLGWQIAQWLLSAGRPKASLMHGVSKGSGAIVGPVTEAEPGLRTSRLREQGMNGEEIIGIQITNHGRSPVSVERVALCPRGGHTRFIPADQLMGPELPYRLEAGTNASWYLAFDHAHTLVRASRDALGEPVRGVYMRATLGTGKEIQTPETLRF